MKTISWKTKQLNSFVFRPKEALDTCYFSESVLRLQKTSNIDKNQKLHDSFLRKTRVVAKKFITSSFKTKDFVHCYLPLKTRKQ